MLSDDPPAAESNPCGTVAAYQRHRRRGEAACGLCAEANRQKSRARRADPELRVEEVARNLARTRALWRLANEYPERFRALSTDELLKISEVADAT